MQPICFQSIQISHLFETHYVYRLNNYTFVVIKKHLYCSYDRLPTPSTSLKFIINN